MELKALTKMRIIVKNSFEEYDQNLDVRRLNQNIAAETS